VLPCDAKHYFHASCAREWLKKNAVCPLCREKVEDSIKRTGGQGQGQEASGSLRALNIDASPTQSQTTIEMQNLKP